MHSNRKCQKLFLISFFLLVPDDSAIMQQQMGGMGGGAPAATDLSKVFQSEKDSLEIVRHEFALDAVEAKLVGINK